MFKKVGLVITLLSVLTFTNNKLTKAQEIKPDNNTNTTITTEGNRIIINGTTLSGDGINLFHSFQEFGLSQDQIASFLTNPNIQNILSRITGGNPSYINGLIEVVGGNSNLFLMNPAGIVFGDNASLNVMGDFTATTATGISFNNVVFNAIASNNYSTLVGNPTGFIFNSGQNPGSIINSGTLKVNGDSNINLIAGNVLNSGTIQTPQGRINIEKVGDGSQVIIRPEGNVLGIKIDTSEAQLGFEVRDLSTLLTGANEAGITTTGIATNSEKDNIQVTVSDMPIVASDDGTNTEVSSDDGFNIKITGGTLSPDQKNLFHSFSRFDLPKSTQVANFDITQTKANNENFENIFARVSSGDVSVINGIIKVTGGTGDFGNLILMNPAGIVFGASASLNVPADFYATTATGIRFNDDNWFSATGAYDANLLTEDPKSVGFTVDNPAGIINAANLKAGNSEENRGFLGLAGGTIVNTSNLSSSDEGVALISAKGQSIVNLDLYFVSNASENIKLPNSYDLNVATLSDLVNNSDVNGDLGVSVINSNSLQLNNSPTIIENGDITVDYIDSEGYVAIVSERLFTAQDVNKNGNSIQSNGIAEVTFNNTLYRFGVLIEHGGGQIDVPFIVGDSTRNGTKGSIRSFDDQTNSTRSFEGNYIAPNNTTRIITGINFPPDNCTYLGCVENPDTTPPDSIPTQPEILPNISSIVEAKEILNAIEKIGDEKPALIYVSFTPKGYQPANVEEDFKRRESVNTQEYQKIGVRNPNLPPTLNTEIEDDDLLDILIITSNDQPFRIKVPVTYKEIIASANNLSEKISDIFLRDDSYKPYASELYSKLIAPLEKELTKREITNLLFILPPEMRLTPMAALLDENGKFLVEKYSSGLAPSLNLNDNRYRDIKNMSLLAMGASSFNDPNNPDVDDLPAVGIEIPTIRKIWDGQSLTNESQYLNENFTFDQLKNNITSKSYGIIHLGTHGEFNPEERNDSEDTYIQLYNSRLGLNDMRNLNLNDPLVELLVLSACKTAFGDEFAELGFAGLAVKAGVKTALGSLWYVSDIATLGLMSDFYSQLKQQSTKAEALRQAQLNMLQGNIYKSEDGTQIITPNIQVSLDELSEDAKGSEDFSHPYYWAPFTLIGNPW